MQAPVRQQTTPEGEQPSDSGVAALRGERESCSRSSPDDTAPHLAVHRDQAGIVDFFMPAPRALDGTSVVVWSPDLQRGL